MMLQSALAHPETSAALADDGSASLIRAAPYAVAIAVPPTRITSAELAERLGTTEEWIVSRTGVRERPVAEPGERLSDYATRAGAAALERAGIEAAELDLVVAATMTADELTPYASTVVAHGLGADHAGAFDLGAACTAFLSGMAVAAAQIETGRCRYVLVIGADFISRLTDPTDRRTTPLFSDAAGAVVFGPARTESAGIGPIVLGADGSDAARAIVIAHHDRKLQMDGPEVYRHAVARMAEASLAAVERAGLGLEDIDLFAFHQANRRITHALGERLGLDPSRVVDCIETLGNSSAATLPLALATAEADGRLKPGSRVLLAAFGGGFTWGAAVIEWGGGER
ncbi:MAG TPA: beta-ketoacyl-ACP synthase 3 [Solirubrobacteraceae bacterium]|nr:beta-ketoacyl-ACP synthase 3 [Solirubrobacteraceae bacterium]